MSWWTKLRDTVEKVGTLGMYDPGAIREAERNQRNLVNEQIKAYREQTELTRKQTDEARAAQAVERRRIEEKQIRALRNKYRAQPTSLLGSGQAATPDMNTKLGG